MECYSKISLQSLPLELLDMIMMKAVVMLVLSSWEDAGYRIQLNAYQHLATVWSEWFYRLRTRWFRIVLQRKLKRLNPLTKYLEIPDLVNAIDVKHSVWGLALLNGELYVASIDTASLYVYDAMNFHVRRTVRLVGLSGPRDITACQLNKCLYIVNVVSGLSMFRLDTEGKVAAQWHIDYEPHNLSMTASGNVILTCDARILEYKSDGTLLQNVALDNADLSMSWQTIRLVSGNYVVCQGWMNTGSNLHRVVTLNPSGKIIRTLSGGDGKVSADNAAARLNNPVYMTVDRDGCILVADSGNNQVVLLSPRLVFLRSLITEAADKVVQPYRVLLDNSSGRLFVGTNTGKLLVYRVFKQ